MKYDLIKLEEIDNLETNQIEKYYTAHINPGLLKFLTILGFNKISPEYAEGIYIYTKCKRKIYDFTGGISVLNLGHNHPRILQARRQFNKNKKMEVWKAFLSPYLAVLSKNLAAISPGDLNYPFFCNSGAEANEGALKIAEKYQGKGKKYIIYTDISFHGKTHAMLSVSGCETSKEHFRLLDNCIEIPYGDWEAFEKVILDHRIDNTPKNDIIAIILEAIHAEGVIIPPKGYLKKIRELCDKYNIIMIIDDVFCGFGRTGKMFSFEHENIIPDIFTVSKSLGGGKASIAAYVARDNIFKKAYGDLKDAMIHTTTFNGLGEECYTAIEAINVLIEENLVENSAILGKYFLESLNKLKEKYPDIIKEVRGIGLLINVELHKPAKKIIGFISKYNSFVEGFSEGFLSGMILSNLLIKYNILIFVGQHNKNTLFINPPLIINKDEIDYFVNSLDELLQKGIFNLVKDYILMRSKNLIF